MKNIKLTPYQMAYIRKYIGISELASLLIENWEYIWAELVTNDNGDVFIYDWDIFHLIPPYRMASWRVYASPSALFDILYKYQENNKRAYLGWLPVDILISNPPKPLSFFQKIKLFFLKIKK